jgi:hypothetical protein
MTCCILRSALSWDITERCTDVSEQPIGPNFNVREVLDFLTLEDGTETPVHDYQSALRNIPEEYRYHLHRGQSLESRMLRVITRMRFTPRCLFHYKVKINPLKANRICFIEGLSAYRAVNTLHFGYKNQPLNVL